MGKGKATKNPEEFIEGIPDNQLEKFNLHEKMNTIYPGKNDSKSNFRLDMQGMARNGTCFNLQVQINKDGASSSWRKASTNMKTTIATCIANPKANATQVRKALLASLEDGGIEKTAGEVPEE
ncbi:hypothetical protein EDD21DRAFT_374460 [Dissophora ornata]|nr:hypothetical protein BGZ58_009470 [Dissophora ornata]KAI8601439.1 hypothetical protein EDD21DRAFT_374460 [Dissophora ornata]